MANYLNIANGEENIDLQSYGRQVCLPSLVDCRASCELIAKDCAQLFNCNLQGGETSYCLKYEAGNSFDIQLRVIDEYNADPTTPVSGWGLFITAELINSDDVVVSTDYTAFASDYVVGYTEGVGSYQTIRLNFDNCEALAGTCFSVKFRVFDSAAAEVEVFCTENFKKMVGCDSLLYLESIYSYLDCCGNYYGVGDVFVGSSNFQYSNRIGIYAVLQNEEGSVEVETFGSIRTSTIILDVKNVSLFEKIPYYLHQYLKNVLAGEKIFVDSNQYLMDGFTPEISSAALPMFIYSFNVYNECEKIFGCN